MFCRNCGNKVEKTKICMNCGVEPLRMDNFCQNCGVETKSIQEICIECGVKLKKNFSFNNLSGVGNLFGKLNQAMDKMNKFLFIGSIFIFILIYILDEFRNDMLIMELNYILLPQIVYLWLIFSIIFIVRFIYKFFKR